MPFTSYHEKATKALQRARLEVADHLSIKMKKIPRSAHPVDLSACSSHCPFNVSSRETVNTKFKVIGLTRLGIKPESTAPEVDAPTTRPSKLLKY